MHQDSFFRKTISMSQTGMLSSCKIPPIQSGILVFFDFGSRSTDTLDIFPCFDKVLSHTPFVSGNPMATPICGLDRIWPHSHTSSAIVIDKAEVKLPEMSPQIPQILLPYRGFLVSAKLRCTLRAIIRCADPRLLAQHHLEGLKNPEETVRDSLQAYFSDISSEIFSEKLKQKAFTPYNISKYILQLNDLIRNKTAAKITREYPWLQLHQFHSTITLENDQEVAEQVNTIETKILDFLMTQVSKSPLTPEATSIILEIIRTKPNYTEADILNLIKRFHSMLSYFSPQELERFWEKERNHYLVEKGGNEYGA